MGRVWSVFQFETSHCIGNVVNTVRKPSIFTTFPGFTTTVGYMVVDHHNNTELHFVTDAFCVTTNFQQYAFY